MKLSKIILLHLPKAKSLQPQGSIAQLWELSRQGQVYPVSPYSGERLKPEHSRLKRWERTDSSGTPVPWCDKNAPGEHRLLCVLDLLTTHAGSWLPCALRLSPFWSSLLWKFPSSSGTEHTESLYYEHQDRNGLFSTSGTRMQKHNRDRHPPSPILLKEVASCRKSFMPLFLLYDLPPTCL